MKGREKGGRPSKLSDKQWDELIRRKVAGEKPADLAREYDVNPSQVSRRVSQRAKQVETVAAQVAKAELAFERLPVSQQGFARNLADELKGIQNHLAQAAHSGAKTASIMAKLAEQQAKRLRQRADDEGDVQPEEMRPLAAMIEVSNKAASTGMGLMQIGKKDGQPIDDGEKAIRDMSDEDLMRLVRMAAEDSK